MTTENNIPTDQITPETQLDATVVTDETIVDSPDATVDTTETAAVEEAPASSGPSQEDFNKLYFEMKQSERDREALQTQIDATQATIHEQPEQTDLTLEMFDYDEDAFNQASIQQAVQTQVAAALKEQATHTQQATIQEAQQNTAAQFNEKAVAYAATNPDYEKAIQVAGNNAQYPSHVQEAILHSDVGPQIDHMLLSNPQILQQLSGMSPTQALMELGRMESSVKVPVAPTPAKVSGAPEPIDNVGGSSHNASDFRYDEEMSMEDYYAKTMAVKKG